MSVSSFSISEVGVGLSAQEYAWAMRDMNTLIRTPVVTQVFVAVTFQLHMTVPETRGYILAPNFSAALIHLNKAIAFDRQHVPSLSLKGEILKQMGQDQAAFECFLSAAQHSRLASIKEKPLIFFQENTHLVYRKCIPSDLSEANISAELTAAKSALENAPHALTRLQALIKIQDIFKRYMSLVPEAMKQSIYLQLEKKAGSKYFIWQQLFPNGDPDGRVRRVCQEILMSLNRYRDG